MYENGVKGSFSYTMMNIEDGWEEMAQNNNELKCKLYIKE